ncbi:class A beta-lactamase [Streptomyces collinus]|uniref:Beta-lactamase n=1 Tax=Streptomyces collinus TaxID=42684 RepID=A0AA89Q3W4_STRCU|nr:class A beta-lactamase [Streptomyces collinus]MBB5809495.1 beta-lactamase class A [Streptomyces collinus]WMX62837.1 class A beta-lactamase [Streptomyces collinus]
MHTNTPHPSRRTALALGTAAALALGGGTAHALPGTTGVTARLRDLEREHTARLGVYARNMRTGRTVAYRADELFPMASVFKTLAAAAVLRDLDRDGEFLARRIHYTQAYVTRSGFSPVTKDHVATGMTVGELCDATIRFSDNTAGNLLLKELGGPTAITRFARSTGDRVTRLDRWEPELNSAEPWRVTDTTSPRAIGLTYARLVLGDVLETRDRARLTDWLLRNTTSLERFRKGLPADWLLADKTGGGQYGSNNDVGITWPPDGPPIVMSVLTTQPEEDAPADNPLVAGAAALLAAELA